MGIYACRIKGERMRNLEINKGYKTYTINGDESAVITVKTTDFTIIERLTKVKSHISAIVSELKNIKEGSPAEVYLSALSDAEQKVRAELDAVFDSPVSETVFGSMNCLSFAGGQPVALNFLEVIIPEITKDLNEEQQAASARISKYTEAVKGLQ